MPAINIVHSLNIKRIIIFSLLVKLSLMSVVLISNPKGIWAPDSISYWRNAQALLQHQKFASSPENPQQIETWRTPGYPILLACILGITGNQVIWVIITQIALSLLTIYLTFRLGELLFGYRAGLFASLFLAMDLTSLTSTQYILTETLFDLLLISSVWFSINWHSLDFSLKSFVYKPMLTGLSLSIATLVRPVIYYYLPFLVLLFVLFGKLKRNNLKQLTKLTASVSIPLILLVGGWQVRNGLLSGNYEISSIQGYNLLYYRAAGVVALRDGISLGKARENIYKLIDPNNNFDNIDNINSKIGKIFRNNGIKIILQHPLLYIKSHLKGTINMMLNPGSFSLINLFGFYHKDQDKQSLHDAFFLLDFGDFITGLFKEHMILFFSIIISGTYLMLYYSVVIFGLIQTDYKNNSWIHLFIITLVIYLLLISGGAEAHDRFREPVMPFLSLYAGFGAKCLRK